MNPLRSALPQPSLAELRPLSSPFAAPATAKNGSNTQQDQLPLRVPAGPLDGAQVPVPPVPDIQG